MPLSAEQSALGTEDQTESTVDSCDELSCVTAALT